MPRSLQTLDLDPPPTTSRRCVSDSQITAPVDQRPAKTSIDQHLHRSIHRVPLGNSAQIQSHSRLPQRDPPTRTIDLKQAITHTLASLGQTNCTRKLLLTTSTTPQLRQRTQRYVKCSVGLPRDPLRCLQDIRQISTHSKRDTGPGRITHESQFAVATVVAASGIDFTHPVQSSLRNALCSPLFGRVQYDPEIPSNRLAVEFESQQRLVSQPNLKPGQDHTSRADKHRPVLLPQGTYPSLRGFNMSKLTPGNSTQQPRHSLPWSLCAT